MLTQEQVAEYKQKYGIATKTAPKEEAVDWNNKTWGEAFSKSDDNFIDSNIEMAKGFGSMLAHPIKTLKGIGGLAKAIVTPKRAGAPATDEELKTTGRQTPSQQGLEELNKQYLTSAGWKQRVAEDPAGVLLDVLLLAEGGSSVLKKAGAKAKNIGKLQKLSILAKDAEAVGDMARATEIVNEASKVLDLSKPNIAQKVGNVLNKTGDVVKTATELPVKTTGKVAGKIVKGTGKVGGAVAEQMVKRASNLDTPNIKTIVNNVREWKKAVSNKFDRLSLSRDVERAINTRAGEVSDLGREYDGIRNTNEVVKIPKENPVKKMIEKFNIKLENGKIERTKGTRLVLSDADKKAVEEFIDLFGNEKTLTGDEFLNARSNLSEMAKYDRGGLKTGASPKIAKFLRAEYNKIGKEQLSGLRELDSKFAPEIKEINKLKKDFFDTRTGELKDTALNKIANLKGAGKDKVLNRLEKVVPDIREKINLLKAIEDVESIKKYHKVAGYTSAAITGGGLISGNIPITIAGLMVSTPQAIIPILEAYGELKGISKEIIQTILNKMKAGKVLDLREKKTLSEAIKEYIDKNVSAGMSIKAVDDKGNPVKYGGEAVKKQSLIEQAKKFDSVEEFIEGQIVHNKKDNEISLGNNSLRYSFDDGELVVDNIKVTTPRKGIGTKLMEAVEKIAEKEKLNIGLASSPQDNTISPNNLNSFYESLGYKYLGGSSDASLYEKNLKDLISGEVETKQSLTEIYNKAKKTTLPKKKTPIVSEIKKAKKEGKSFDEFVEEKMETTFIKDSENYTMEIPEIDAKDTKLKSDEFWHGTGGKIFEKFKTRKPVFLTKDSGFANEYAKQNTKGDYPKVFKVKVKDANFFNPKKDYKKLGSILPDKLIINDFRGRSNTISKEKFLKFLNSEDFNWQDIELTTDINNKSIIEYIKKLKYNGSKMKENGKETYILFDPKKAETTKSQLKKLWEKTK